ncbi:MAG: chemotaxis protein CheR [Alphaproteobacteria bacterium]|nr:chemotaxis protein CheR [Alphaproteobacteria bacterium]
MTPQNFATIAATLHAGSGLAIGPDKLYLLESRLGTVMRAHRIADLDALAERLRAPGSAALLQAVIEAMTTNESSFFRDGKPFEHLRQHALPRLHAARSPGAKLRIWSAAASTGQEAYSIAMLLTDLRAALAGRGVEIVGTDIARAALLRASEGLYSQFEVQRGLPVQMLLRHFHKQGEMWRIADELRAMASFRECNLLGDLRPLGCFDIVFCRNVLIYFDPPTKARALAAIARQMAPDGLLYLGGAETVLGISDRFAPLGADPGVYGLAEASAPPASAPVLAAALR